MKQTSCYVRFFLMLLATSFVATSHGNVNTSDAVVGLAAEDKVIYKILNNQRKILNQDQIKRIIGRRSQACLSDPMLDKCISNVIWASAACDTNRNENFAQELWLSLVDISQQEAQLLRVLTEVKRCSSKPKPMQFIATIAIFEKLMRMGKVKALEAEILWANAYFAGHVFEINKSLKQINAFIGLLTNTVPVQNQLLKDFYKLISRMQINYSQNIEGSSEEIERFYEKIAWTAFNVGETINFNKNFIAKINTLDITKNLSLGIVLFKNACLQWNLSNDGKRCEVALHKLLVEGRKQNVSAAVIFYLERMIALNLSEQGDIGGALKSLEKLLSQSTSPMQKAWILLPLAEMEMFSGRTEVAKKYISEHIKILTDLKESSVAKSYGKYVNIGILLSEKKITLASQEFKLLNSEIEKNIVGPHDLKIWILWQGLILAAQSKDGGMAERYSKQIKVLLLQNPLLSFFSYIADYCASSAKGQRTQIINGAKKILGSSHPIIVHTEKQCTI